MSTECVIRITDENGATVSDDHSYSPCRTRMVSPPPPVNRMAADFFINSKNAAPLKVSQVNRPNEKAEKN